MPRFRLNTINIDYFNSETHETTKTNILADKEIYLTPGFFQDYTNEFSWIPFECEEKFEFYLCIRTSDTREQLKDFINIPKILNCMLNFKILVILNYRFFTKFML